MGLNIEAQEQLTSAKLLLVAVNGMVWVLVVLC